MLDHTWILKAAGIQSDRNEGATWKQQLNRQMWADKMLIRVTQSLGRMASVTMKAGRARQMTALFHKILSKLNILPFHLPP